MSTIQWKVAKTYSDITYHKADGIAKVTINRPEKRNAFRPETVSQMFDAFCDGPHILIGSSMGGWIALLLARALRLRGDTGRLAGMALVAPAPDFTQDLMWNQFSPEIRAEIETKGFWRRPSEYDGDGYIVTHALIEDGRAKGAKVVTIPDGAAPDPATRRIPPTLLVGATDAMQVMREEIFGPILPVESYARLDDAIAAVTRRPRPLAFYVFAEDRAVRERLLRETIAGGVPVNDLSLIPI